MTAREYIESLRARIAALQANRARDALRIATDLNALVRLRINTSGRDSMNRPFTPYSPGYAQQRQQKGRQASFVDFNFTGRLQAATRSYVEKEDKNAVVIITTAKGRDNQAKLRGAMTQPKGRPRGNILLASQQEIAQAQQANLQRVMKYLRGK